MLAKRLKHVERDRIESLPKIPKLLYLRETQQALFRGFLNETVLILALGEQQFKYPSKEGRGPINILHFHDKNGLQRVDRFLPELPLLAQESVVDVSFDEVIEVLEGADIGQKAVMRCFSDLRLAIT